MNNYFKRLLLCLLAVAVVIGGAGCGLSYEKSKAPFSDALLSQSTPGNSDSSSSQSGNYKDIETRHVEVVKRIGFTHSVGTVEFSVAQDWSYELSENGDYTVKRDGKKIGYISSSNPPLPTKSYEKKIQTLGYYPHSANYAVYQYGTGKNATYHHFFSYNLLVENNTYRTVMMIDYAELSAENVSKFYRSFGPKVDTEFKPLNIMNGKEKILIVGNMNVTGSKMAQFLRDFIKVSGRSHTVEIQNYHGETSLKNWQSLDQLKKVKDGEYGAVILTGFTDYADVNGFGSFHSACRDASTAIGIMKTHFDSDRVTKPLLDDFKEFATVIDLEAELEQLVRIGVRGECLYRLGTNGVNSYEATAGYVGAMMIYSELFKEIPPRLSETSVDEQTLNNIRSYLGNYANHGNAGIMTMVDFVEHYPF